MKVQVDHKVYNGLFYNDKGRFNSFWHQVDAIVSSKAKDVLEVGTGSGFVKFALEKNGIKVTTLDIDPNLHPDILGSVLNIPVAENTFDAVLCCQVLEHLPYENFITALSEIRRVTSNYVVLSLPDLHRVYRMNIQAPLIGEIKFLYSIPRLWPQEWRFDGEHYWNISCKGYPLKRIMKDIQQAGFSVEKMFCVFEISWHRFFILRK